MKRSYTVQIHSMYSRKMAELTVGVPHQLGTGQRKEVFLYPFMGSLQKEDFRFGLEEKSGDSFYNSSRFRAPQ